MNHICELSEICGFPLLTAFLLGFMAALNPCQLAINVSALTWLLGRKNQSVWQTGILYLSGRFVAHFLLGWGCVLAVSWFNLQPVTLNVFSWVEIVLPFLLLAIGIFFLYRAFHAHRHDGSCHNSGLIIHRGRRFGAFGLGVILAFLFCPESALIFFGMMVPLGTASAQSWIIPMVFAVSSLIPFVLLLWTMRHAAALVIRYEARVSRLQVWVNALLGLLFILLAILVWLQG